MKLVRAKQVFVTVTAILSLFVSAVSACACSHHEPVKVEAESCHSSSHAAPAAEQSAGTAVIASDCNCLVRDPVPAVVAKKDDKRVAIEKQFAKVVEFSLTFEIDLEIADASDVPFEPPISNFQHALLSSLPSRAPRACSSEKSDLVLRRVLRLRFYFEAWIDASCTLNRDTTELRREL